MRLRNKRTSVYMQSNSSTTTSKSADRIFCKVVHSTNI